MCRAKAPFPPGDGALLAGFLPHPVPKLRLGNVRAPLHLQAGPRVGVWKPEFVTSEGPEFSS